MKTYIIKIGSSYGRERTTTVRAKSLAEAISGVYRSSGEFVLSCRELV